MNEDTRYLTAEEFDAINLDPDVEECMQRNHKGYTCTRTAGHDGVHMSAGFDSVHHRWEVPS